jgi:hypothetical protein
MYKKKIQQIWKELAVKYLCTQKGCEKGPKCVTMHKVVACG